MMVLAQLLLNGFVNGCLYAVMSLSFALIYNTIRIFHIAHGGIYALAAYCCYLFSVTCGLGLPWSIGLSLAVVALTGVLVEQFLYQPLEQKRASPLVALLSSLGLYVVMVNTITLTFGNETKVLRSGIEPVMHLGPLILSRIQFAQMMTTAILLPALLMLLRFTPLGKMIRAVRDNPALVQVMGINVRMIRLVVFAIGSTVAGVAAILSALDVGTDPNVGMPALLIAAVALIVGGINTFEGAIVGALLLGILQGLVVWKLSTRWTDAVTYAVLIMFLLLRPEGIIGKRRRIEESTR